MTWRIEKRSLNCHSLSSIPSKLTTLTYQRLH
jgi:hypothetical protein